MTAIKFDGLVMPGEEDFKERVELNLGNKISLKAQLAEADELVRELEWTAARSMFHANIYKDLKRYIELRIKLEESNANTNTN